MKKIAFLPQILAKVKNWLESLAKQRSCFKVSFQYKKLNRIRMPDICILSKMQFTTCVLLSFDKFMLD